MPSEAPSPRKRILVASAPARLPPGLFLAFVLLASVPVACASNSPPQAFASTRDALAELDEFGVLLLGTGLPVEVIPSGREVSPEQARRLLVYFSFLPYSPQHYGPRFVAAELLRAIENHGQAVSRWELSRKVQDYRNLFLLQPDGYLAAALTGRPAVCVGPVEPREDGAGAGRFEMGAFYTRDEEDNWQQVHSPTVALSP